MRARIAVIGSVALTVIAAASSYSGEKPRPSIGGTVIGPNGKPCPEVEIHAKRVDAKMPVVVATADRRGAYAFAGLPIGMYSLTAYLDGFAQSRATIKTQSKGWMKVDFDLRLDAGDGVDRMQKDFRGFLVIPNQNQH